MRELKALVVELGFLSLLLLLDFSKALFLRLWSRESLAEDATAPEALSKVVKSVCCMGG